MYDCGVSDAGAPLSRSRGVPLSAIFLRGCGTGAGCRCCGAAGSAAFCRSIATMPSPLRSAEPEAALPSQIAAKGTLGLRAPVGIEVAAIVVAALYFGREVLVPVTLAMLLSFVLSPLVELLRQVWLRGDLFVPLPLVPALGPLPCPRSAVGSPV